MSASPADRRAVAPLRFQPRFVTGRHRRLLAAVALFSVCALPWPAPAQQGVQAQQGTQTRDVQPQGTQSNGSGGPVKLTPPISLVPGQPAAGGGRVPSAAALRGDPAGGVQVKKGIEIDSLSEVDPDSIGAIDPERGGLGGNLWASSELASVSNLLRRTPAQIASPTLRDLLARTLLSSAEPPKDDGSPARIAQGPAIGPAIGSDAAPGFAPRAAATPESGPGFLALRARLLADLGETRGLNDLLKAVPSREMDAVIAEVRAETLMLLEDDPAACAIVRDAIGSYPPAPFWSKALIHCRIAEGDLDGALLGLDLLREGAGGAGDPAFFALVEGAAAAGGGAGNEIEAADPTPLHMSLARITGQHVLPADLESVRPSVLAAMASSDGYDLGVRTEAAERAVALGSLPAPALRELYGAFTFGEDERQAPIEAASLAEGARGRALLYQSARDQALPVARAELLDEAFRRMRAAGLGLAGIEVFLPQLTAIEPTPELLWFSETAGKALFLAGRAEQASAWATVATRLAAINPRARGAALGLWPYQRLSGAGAPVLPAPVDPVAAPTGAAAAGAPSGGGELGIAAWYTQRSAFLHDFADQDAAASDGPELTFRDAILLRALFDGVGESDPLNWSDLAVTPTVTPGGDGSEAVRDDPILAFALEQASRANRKGETVLLAAMAANDPAGAARELLTISSAVRAVGRIGLDREARRLALEAAYAAGL